MKQQTTCRMPLWSWVGGASLLLVVGWLTLFVTIPIDPNNPEIGWAIRGQFGDSFGGIAALATALAFAGLLYTIQLQRREMEVQVKAIRKAELQSALTAQFHVLIQIQGMENTERRDATWRAICEAPGGPGIGSSIERAIAIQIGYLDRLANGEDVDQIPTYS
ncbi:MAG TPA: hypothetical protein PKD45_14990 [Flavobacteriales bacterium]|nr:hypothetical protein [Flavobacteriales bacterium]